MRTTGTLRNLDQERREALEKNHDFACCVPIVFGPKVSARKKYFPLTLRFWPELVFFKENFPHLRTAVSIIGAQLGGRNLIFGW